MEAERARAARAADEDLRPAAVLLIAYERAGEPWVLFTRRTERVADHKGQICFPGGSRDPADGSLLETALREAQEELGVDPGELRVIDSLDPVFTVVTRYVIAPFVAYAPARPALHPDPFEVAEVIDAPVVLLLDPAIRRVESWDSHGVQRDVYFFQFGEHNVWGATARILKQFLDRYTPAWWRAVARGEVTYQPAGNRPPEPA